MATNSDNADFFDEDSDSQSNYREVLDFQFYLRILRKNKWVIAIFTALVTMLASYYAYTTTPIYRSASTLLIESQKANVLRIEELYGIDSENSDYYGTQHEILKSRALAKRVVRRLGLHETGLPTENPATSVASQGGPNAEAGDPIAQLINRARALIGFPAESTDFNGQPASDATVPATQLPQDSGSDLRRPTAFQATDGSVVDSVQGDDPFFDETVRQFQNALTITPLRKTKLVRISFESPDPVFAALVANSVADEYIVSVLDGRMKMKEKASAWMNERVGVLKAKLDQSEQNLITFKEENGLIDVNGSVGRLNEQELLLATTELAEAKSELSDARDLFREVQSMKTAAPELLETIPAIQDDVLVRSVKIELGQRQRELDELANRYGARHPKIIDAESRLGSLRSTLDGHISRVVATIEKDYQLRRQRVAAIESTLRRGKENIQVIGQKKFRLDALEREVSTNREIYNQFFSRITETDSSDGLDEANARISDFADPSAVPVKPRKQVIIALAALASLFLSMLMAVLYEQFDESIKGTEDVEGRLGVRLLGILPLVNKSLLGKAKALPLNPLEVDDKRGTFVESVNTVRTALTIENGGDNQVILVTSSVPGEGKSTSSLNLAYSFSQLERVLLIDCDMRRPSLAKALGLNRNAEGLSNLITQSASAKVCIRRSAVGNLDVLTSGPTPQQPLELLSSNRFVKILTELRKHYDKIIIDSAPTQAVSDSLVLSRLVDAVVYVVKSHDTSRNLVRRGLARLKQVDAPVSGILMTQVDVDKISSYGGDYYYQGYYDYYGYTEQGGAANKNKVRLTPDELRRIKLDDEEVALDIADYVQSSRRNSPKQRELQHDDSLLFENPFELTQQIESTQRREVRPAPARTSNARSLSSDDLDLV